MNVPVDPSLPSSFRIWSNFGVIKISGDLYCPKNGKRRLFPGNPFASKNTVLLFAKGFTVVPT